MDIPASLFTTHYLVVLSIMFLYLMYQVAIRAPWHILLDMPAVLPASITLTLLVWSIRTEIVAGQGFHFLGVTLLTLMYGWEISFMAATLIVTMVSLFQGLGLLAIPLNTLLMGGIPVAVTMGLLRLSERRLPPNLFVYIFIPGFFGGVVSMLLVVLTSSLLLYVTTGSEGSGQISQYLLFVPLMMLPEGTVNGMIISILVAFYPQYLKTYQESLYPGGP